MKVLMFITDIPEEKTAYVRVEDPDTGKPLAPDIVMTNAEQQSVEVPEGCDLRVFLETEAGYAAQDQYLRTGTAGA